MASKKLAQNTSTGLWTYYGAPEDIAAVGEVQDADGITYVISFHKGLMPPFNIERFQTLDELEARMREVEPDLRKWRTRAS